jgi:hypothetical protein
MRKFGSGHVFGDGEAFGDRRDERPEGMIVAAVLVGSLVGALAYLLF